MGQTSASHLLPLAYEGIKPRLWAIDANQKAALRPWERPKSRGFCSRRGTARCDVLSAKTHFSITMEPN